MKWNKWVVVFMALCTMLTVTSCLGDDDKYELSQDQMKQAMKAMKGTYTGKLKWQATSGVKYDSLNNVSYTVNDTAIIIHNFPVSSLAAGVLEGTANDSLRNAFKAAPAQDLVCAITFYYSENFLNPHCLLNIMPYSIFIKNAEINTRKYELQVNFLNNNTNSMGYFNNERKTLEINMRTYNLMVNKQQQVGIYKTVYFQLSPNDK